MTLIKDFVKKKIEKSERERGQSLHSEYIPKNMEIPVKVVLITRVNPLILIYNFVLLDDSETL